MEQYTIGLFNGRCDTVLLRYFSGGGLCRSNSHVDLGRMGKYYRYAQFFALFGEPESIPVRDLSGKIHRELFLEEYTLFERGMMTNVDLAAFRRTGAEAEAAFQSGRQATFPSVEGAELLDYSLERPGEAHVMSIRAVSPTWNHTSALSDMNVEESERGSTHQGKAFVRKIERLGILAGVSHLSDLGLWDMTEELSGPLFASYSNAQAAFPHPRNLTDEQFTTIIDHNGVVGLNLYIDLLGERTGLDTITTRLEHWLELGGERTVALGGDLDGCSSLPGGITGIQDLDRPWERLLQQNYSEALVHAPFFENLMRVANEVCAI